MKCIKCIKCGNENVQAAKFCSYCGNNLLNVDNNVLNTNVNSNNNSIPKQNNGLAVASFVIGIISIILCIFLNILILPFAIIGLVLGICNKNKYKLKTIGIILNSVSVVIVLLLLICTYVFISKHMDDILPPPPVTGVWNCKIVSGSGIEDEYHLTLKLNEDYSFVNNKYLDEANNHVYGYYTYEDLNETNESGEFSYYSITLTGTEYVYNGVLQNQKYINKYEIGINSNNNEAVLMNLSQYYTYYCYKQ